MSANDQILIKNYKHKWYVFNIMAESWSEDNELPLSQAKQVFTREVEAYRYATKEARYSEYGVSSILVKDGAEVKLVDQPKGKDSNN